jgi:N-acetyl-1-D-myo-inositol-2-amino-2-deoxy-alpha-D-glucopyranoside deacetylase
MIEKVYWTAFPVSVMRAGIEMLKAAGEDTGFAAQDPDEIPFACPDEYVTTAIDGGEFADQKMRALRAHATQISTEEGFFALSNNLGSQVMGTEYYRLVAGVPAGPFDELGRETDLFNGIASDQ